MFGLGKIQAAIGVLIILAAAVTYLRTDAASDAIRDALSRFNENRLEQIEADKESDNEVDQITADCLADAALNGLRSSNCGDGG